MTHHSNLFESLEQRTLLAAMAIVPPTAHIQNGTLVISLAPTDAKVNARVSVVEHGDGVLTTVVLNKGGKKQTFQHTEDIPISTVTIRASSKADKVVATVSRGIRLRDIDVVVDGKEGNDVLSSYAATLLGGLGNDRLTYRGDVDGTAPSLMDPGPGKTNTVILKMAGAQVHVGFGGIDTVWGSREPDTIHVLGLGKVIFHTRGSNQIPRDRIIIPNTVQDLRLPKLLKVDGAKVVRLTIVLFGGTSNEVYEYDGKLGSPGPYRLTVVE